MWVVVSEKTESPIEQQIITKTELPTQELASLWENGMRVGHFAYGGGNWVIIAEPNPSHQAIAQGLFVSQTFPLKKIKEFYETNKCVRTIVHSSTENCWAFILEREKPGIRQKLLYSPSPPQQKLARLGICELSCK